MALRRLTSAKDHSLKYRKQFNIDTQQLVDCFEDFNLSLRRNLLKAGTYASRGWTKAFRALYGVGVQYSQQVARGQTSGVTMTFKTNEALLCYNCSSTHTDWKRCGGDFVPSIFTFNSTRMFLINCTGENAMCFVRSWTARARHAWIVQRGCYQSTAEDALPRSMTVPTRAMTCKHERHPDAEYKVCLCQADWCNSATNLLPSIAQYLLKLSTFIVGSIIIF